MAGENPTLYHAVNVVGHGLVSLLVVLVLAHLVTLPIAFAAGLLFAVHPVHVEAVSNVVGGAEVLAAGFFMLALLLHLRGPPSWTRAIVHPFHPSAGLSFQDDRVGLGTLKSGSDERRSKSRRGSSTTPAVTGPSGGTSTRARPE